MSKGVFSHNTAAIIYRRFGSRVLCRPLNDLDPRDVNATSKMLSGTGWERWAESAGLLHMLSGNARAKRRDEKLQVHAFGSLDVWSAYDLGAGFYISSPEFLFLQMAQQLSLAKLAFLGSELCGSYEMPGSELQRRSPITTPGSMRAFLEKHQNVRGSKKALRALELVVAGCASPMEVSLTLMLTLPVRLGGYGLTQPSVNVPIQLSGDAEAWYGYHEITPDLFWPNEKLAVEYDSDAYHSTEPSVARDSQRRLVFRQLGIQVITVTRAQMRNRRQLDTIAYAIAAQLGKRIRKTAASSLEVRKRLHEELWEMIR